MNQVSLFDSRPTDEQAARPSDGELLAYDDLRPIIGAICPELNIQGDKFQLKGCMGYSSVYYGSALVMRLKIRGKAHYISVPKSWLEDLPDGTEWEEKKSDAGRVRLPVADNVGEVLGRLGAPIIRAAISHVPKEFDCCSRFEQCSDAMKCIHPDPDFALLCGYRKVLASGRVFYGKNRNV